jgi:hypothetical protein
MPDTPTIQLKPKLGYSIPFFISGMIFLFLGVAMIAIALYGDAQTDPLAWILKILLVLFALYTLLIGATFLFAHKITSLSMDGQGITYRSIFHTISIQWSEVRGYKLSKGTFFLVCKKNASYRRGPLSRLIWGNAEQVEIPIYPFVSGTTWPGDWEREPVLKLVREKSPVDIGDVLMGVGQANW